MTTPQFVLKGDLFLMAMAAKKGVKLGLILVYCDYVVYVMSVFDRFSGSGEDWK